jgi:cysteine desulfurase/selenocysteine lyase
LEDFKTKTGMPEEVTRDHGEFDPENIRRDFPILKRKIGNNPLIYLDNAATTQKPSSVISAINDYYTKTNSNVHRGLHTLAEESTMAFEATRQKIADFIGGVKTEEIVYTRNATEAINLVAYSWGGKNIKKGDRIVLTEMEHHANLVPWIALAKETGAELKYIPIDDNYRLDMSGIEKIISANTKLVAITHMSNVLGTINPVEEIGKLAHKNGALFLVDGAQSAPHMAIDVKTIDADFYAFSAHKMLGPTGIGILYGKESFLKEMEPFMYGGEMISEVRYDFADWNNLPWKFEAGTPNIAGAVGFSPALDYLSKIGMKHLRNHEKELTTYTIAGLSEFKSVKIIGPSDTNMRGGAISFVDKDIHPHDLATFLDSRGIAVRAGHHCAQPLMKRFGLAATARASVYIYNTKSDIDRLLEVLREARRYFCDE